MDGDKENTRGGCPAKLFSDDMWSIIHQITSGKLDSTVKATHFINSILCNPITPQMVRNILKQDDFCWQEETFSSQEGKQTGVSQICQIP